VPSSAPAGEVALHLGCVPADVGHDLLDVGWVREEPVIAHAPRVHTKTEVEVVLQLQHLQAAADARGVEEGGGVREAARALHDKSCGSVIGTTLSLML
jgi:hypothetical protein